MESCFHPELASCHPSPPLSPWTF